MSATDGLYDFVYRAMLTEEALDRAGRNRRSVDAAQSQAIAEALSLELLEVDDLEGCATNGHRVYRDRRVRKFGSEVRDPRSDGCVR